jgi:hypothetical protein
MPDKLKKLCIFTESGPLIALAIAAVMVLGMVGPTSAQFFNFGGFQQRPQPQRGGGGFGGGWFGNDTFAPFQQYAPQPRLDRRRRPRNATPYRSATFLCSVTPWRTGSPMVLKTPMPNSPTWA